MCLVLIIYTLIYSELILKLLKIFFIFTTLAVIQGFRGGYQGLLILYQNSIFENCSRNEWFFYFVKKP